MLRWDAEGAKSGRREKVLPVNADGDMKQNSGHSRVAPGPVGVQLTQGSAAWGRLPTDAGPYAVKGWHREPVRIAPSSRPVVLWKSGAAPTSTEMTRFLS